MRTLQLIVIISIFQITLVFAQNNDTSLNSETDKSFLEETSNWWVDIPVWIPGFRGSYSYGDVSIEAEDGSYPGEPTNPIEPPEPGEPPIGGGNILSRLFNSSSYLKFFFMGMVSYNNNKYWVQLDGYEGNVGSSVNFVFNNKEVVRASYQAVLMRLLIGYSFYEKENRSHSRRFTIFGYTGARLHYADIYSDLNRLSNGLDLSFYWGEPVFGIKNRLAFKNWLFKLQGDIGGFYTGKNYSYMIQFICYYRISDLLSFKLGWADWDINHKRTFKDETLILNVHLSGPTTGFTFHF